MTRNLQAALERTPLTRQELVDYLAAVLGRERKVRWNGRLISVPAALMRAGALDEQDSISLTENEIRVTSS